SESTAVQPEVTVSWELDLWGQIADRTRVAQLQYTASRVQRDGAALSIAAATAQAYITLASLDAQLYVTNETLQARRAALDLF
ncbi:TolC family protein, partial [Pseudomonas aeruginosa]|uniref:TolC family protein n=1 Tax=Pseudomonas aeruginosa TaxID=287 RepID=UPI00345805F3